LNFYNPTLNIINKASTVASTYRGFIADCALDHVLMQLSIQIYERLTNTAVDDGHTGGIGARDGCVGRR